MKPIEHLEDITEFHRWYVDKPDIKTMTLSVEYAAGFKPMPLGTLAEVLRDVASKALDMAAFFEEQARELEAKNG